MLNSIIAFYNHPFFIIFGGISATIVILGVILNFVFWILGITPLLWRLGYGRWFRKISIVANNDSYTSLEGDLMGSGIFRKNNISHISSQNLARIKDSDLLLVHYKSFSEKEINEILSYKLHTAGMIFYYPNFSSEKGEFIPNKIRDKISNTPNTSIVNFRGRLLNDVVTTLITTSYEKK